jgi:hypothetical protein
LFIAEAVRHLGRCDVGERHAHIFSLPTGIMSGQVRIAEQSAASVPEHFPRLVGIAIGTFAARPQTLLAEEALAAADGKRYHHAVADLQFGVS